MKKLLKLLIGIVIILVIAFVGIHIYFNNGEATDPPQGKAPVQAKASANADSIQSDLEKHLMQNNADVLMAQITRTIEDAQDSVRAGKKEAGVKYLQNTKDFITSHKEDIEKMQGVNMELVEWFLNAPAEELLTNL